MEDKRGGIGANFKHKAPPWLAAKLGSGATIPPMLQSDSCNSFELDPLPTEGPPRGPYRRDSGPSLSQNVREISAAATLGAVRSERP